MIRTSRLLVRAAAASAALALLAACTQTVEGSATVDPLAVPVLPTPSPTQEIPPDCPGATQKTTVQGLSAADLTATSPDGLARDAGSTALLTPKVFSAGWQTGPADATKLETVIASLGDTPRIYGAQWKGGTPGKPNYQVEHVAVLQFGSLDSSCRFVSDLKAIRAQFSPSDAAGGKPGEMTWSKTYSNGTIDEHWASKGDFVIWTGAFLTKAGRATAASAALMHDQYPRI